MQVVRDPHDQLGLVFLDDRFDGGHVDRTVVGRGLVGHQHAYDLVTGIVRPLQIIK